MSNKINCKFKFSLENIPITTVIIGSLLLFLFILLPWSYNYNKRIIGMIGIMLITLGITIYAINRFDK